MVEERRGEGKENVRQRSSTTQGRVSGRGGGEEEMRERRKRQGR